MKRIIYTAIFLSASWLTGCQEAEYLLFNDIARVQMDEEDEIRTSFYYTDASINRDTVYLTVNTIGIDRTHFRRNTQRIDQSIQRIALFQTVDGDFESLRVIIVAFVLITAAKTGKEQQKTDNV